MLCYRFYVGLLTVDPSTSASPRQLLSSTGAVKATLLDLSSSPFRRKEEDRRHENKGLQTKDCP
jgi:hypothetical protein